MKTIYLMIYKAIYETGRLGLIFLGERNNNICGVHGLL